jgi:hypothetical protein
MEFDFVSSVINMAGCANAQAFSFWLFTTFIHSFIHLFVVPLILLAIGHRT